MNEVVLATIQSLSWAVLALFAIFMIIFFVNDFKNMAKQKNHFFDILKKGIANNTIVSGNDVLELYLGISKSGVYYKKSQYMLNNWLHQFLVLVLSGEVEEKKDDNCKQTLKEKVNEWIEYNKKTIPYSNLPDTDRVLLVDLESFIDSGDKISAKRKIDELAVLIQKQNDTSSRIQKKLTGSSFAAIFSIILTVIFGIASLIK